MKLVIFGDRNFSDYTTLESIILSCDSFKQGLITHVISGRARGADMLGEVFANEHNIPILEFPAEWEKYGRAAGPIRNRQMAEIADLGIGFLAPSSKGTKNMIETCKKLKVPVLVYHIENGKVEIFKEE